MARQRELKKNISVESLGNQTGEIKNNFLPSKLNTLCMLEKNFTVTGKQTDSRNSFK